MVASKVDVSGFDCIKMRGVWLWVDLSHTSHLSGIFGCSWRRCWISAAFPKVF